MKNSVIERDIRATIRLLRFLTHGEGYAEVSVFDVGAGGGFSNGEMTICLERSGLSLKDAEAYSPQEFFDLIRDSLYPYRDDATLEELDSQYKNSKWNK